MIVSIIICQLTLLVSAVSLLSCPTCGFTVTRNAHHTIVTSSIPKNNHWKKHLQKSTTILNVAAYPQDDPDDKDLVRVPRRGGRRRRRRLFDDNAVGGGDNYYDQQEDINNNFEYRNNDSANDNDDYYYNLDNDENDKKIYEPVATTSTARIYNDYEEEEDDYDDDDDEEEEEEHDIFENRIIYSAELDRIDPAGAIERFPELAKDWKFWFELVIVLVLVDIAL